MSDTIGLINELSGQPQNLIRAVFSGESKVKSPWIKVVIRPVKLKESILWQFSYFDTKKNVVKNYSLEEFENKIGEIITFEFKNVSIETTSEIVQINRTKKDKVLLSRKRKNEIVAKIDLSHDHRKDIILQPKEDAGFLSVIEVTDLKGNIKKSKKFHQLNEFLKLVSETITKDFLDTHETINIVDCGCGNAYLTFTLYYYFSKILKKQVKIVGIDTNGELLINHGDKIKALGWENINFVDTKIIDYSPKVTPDIVVALHACDTATDDAIYQSIKWQSQYLFSVPCCHHNIQSQINNSNNLPNELKPIFDYGILKERFGDLITDSFRVLILKIVGYKADIVQFIDSEHTAKNLMIRAVRLEHKVSRQQFISDYNNQKCFLNVKPYLGELLGDKLL